MKQRRHKTPAMEAATKEFMDKEYERGYQTAKMYIAEGRHPKVMADEARAEEYDPDLRTFRAGWLAACGIKPKLELV